jgi:hypothetical protein
MAFYVLCCLCMTPLKRHNVGGPEIVQFCGLLILVDMIYRYFGTGMITHMTPLAMAVFAAGVFFLIWPISLRGRQ